MANGAFKFKDNSGNVVSFISGSGSDIIISGGTLDLSGMSGLTLGNVTLSGTTQNAVSASHAASYLLTSSFNSYSGTTDTVIGSLQTSTSSLNTFTSSANSRLNSIEGVSGSYATTGSNIFIGTQTISGSVVPSVNNTYDLGSPTHQFRHIYISSGSLYIDGTKVLGSTSQELQITTDTGQSFKILEAGSDTITLQSADGNITLASSGGGDVILDPTSGIIALKGTTQIYAGNKVRSSDGNNIVFGDGLTVSGSVTITGFIEAQELRTTYISSSILYRSGSTKFGDELTDTHSFTGSILISGSISVPGSNLVSGSSQVLNGSGVWSGSAQLPSGIVSSSAQTIAHLPSGIVSGSAQTIANLPSGTVSGSVQVDVMSTTNIARLATTGSNTFTGALSGTSATFSSSVTATNMNVFGTTELAYVNGTTQMRISRSGTLARLQNYENGSVSNISLNWEGGNLGVGVTDPSTALDVYKIGSGGALTGAAMTLRSGNASDTSGSQQILFSYNGTTLYRHSIRTRHMSDAAAGNAIDFYTWKYGTDVNSAIGTQHVMTIDGNARVGIQSTTPEAPLHIGGGTNYITFGNNINNAHTDIRLKATNKGEAVIWKASDSYTSYGGAGALNIYNSSDLIAFHPSNTINVAVITSTGIGIGNTNPKFYLHSNDDVTIPNNRYLSFSSEINAANFNKSLVVSYTDDSATAQPKQIGLILHNNSNADNTFSPALVFGSKSASNIYSQATAAIAGRRLTWQQDYNWHGGELYFWTATSGGSSPTNQGIPADAPAMILDSRRRMRVPSQPSFQVHRGSSANFEITNSSDTNVLPFNTVRHDTAGNYNTSTYRFTAPIAGRYFFSATVRWDGSSAGSYLRTFFTVNGSSGNGGSAFNYGHQIKGPSGYSTNYQSLTISAVINLAASDYVSVVGGINSGTTNMHQESQFSGYFLG